jgi:hypothetical protein
MERVGRYCVASDGKEREPWSVKEGRKEEDGVASFGRIEGGK